MKILSNSFVALVLACTPALAQEPPKAPPEMLALKHRYQEESDAATKRIRERYVSDLQSLLQKANEKSDLAGAQAILTELREVAPMPGLTSKLAGTWHFTWSGGSQEVTFSEDGSLSTSRGEKGRWLVQNDKVLMKYANGHADTLLLPLDVHGTNGKSWVGDTQIKGTKVSD